MPPFPSRSKPSPYLTDKSSVFGLAQFEFFLDLFGGVLGGSGDLVPHGDVLAQKAIFSAAVTAALTAEGLPVLMSLTSATSLITRADARFRRLFGSMNELAFMTRWMIEDQGGLARRDLAEIRYRLNRTLLQVKREGYAEAIDRVQRFGLGAPEVHPAAAQR